MIGWLAEHHAKIWDRQIEEYLEAGRLDAVLAEVDKEYEAGRGGAGRATMRHMTLPCFWRHYRELPREI